MFLGQVVLIGGLLVVAEEEMIHENLLLLEALVELVEVVMDQILHLFAEAQL